WQTAGGVSGPVDGLAVAGRLRDGAAAPGGDPLRDVVLGEAVQRGDVAAAACFVRDYHDDVLRWVRRSDPRRVNDEDWCDYFLDVLTERRADGLSKLDRYHGRGSLRGWLRTVVKRHLIDRSRRGPRGLRRRYPMRDLARPQLSPEEEAVLHESL